MDSVCVRERTGLRTSTCQKQSINHVTNWSVSWWVVQMTRFNGVRGGIDVFFFVFPPHKVQVHSISRSGRRERNFSEDAEGDLKLCENVLKFTWQV